MIDTSSVPELDFDSYSLFQVVDMDTLPGYHINIELPSSLDGIFVQSRIEVLLSSFHDGDTEVLNCPLDFPFDAKASVNNLLAIAVGVGEIPQ